MLGDITDGFFRELRTRAADLRRGALRPGRAGQRTLGSLARMRERISRFAAFTPGLVPVLAVIDGVLARMPRRGRLPAADFALLSELVATLSDRSRLEDLAGGRTTPEAWLSGCSAAAGMSAAFTGSLLPETSPGSVPLPGLTAETPSVSEPPPAGPSPAGLPAATSSDAPSPELLAEVSSAGIWLALDGSVPQGRP